MMITSEEIGITSEVIRINGEVILTEKQLKTPQNHDFSKVQKSRVFHCPAHKFSKREFMPFYSEEKAITSERMMITSEEIDVIGEEIRLIFGRYTHFWGRNEDKWGNNSCNKNAERFCPA